MSDWISTLLGQLHASAGNQFFSGGFALLILGVIFAALRTLPKRVWNTVLRISTVSINVTSTEPTFNWICLWLTQQSYVSRTRRIALKDVQGKTICIPAKGNHFFLWHRRPVWFSWIDEDGKIGVNTDISGMMMSRERLQLRIVGQNHALVHTLLSEVQALRAQNTEGKLKVFLRHGSWSPSWQLELRDPRPLSTVFLPEAAYSLKPDIEKFLSERVRYRRLGIPYRRGYLLHGVPGSGKSTIAVALASELNLPLYVLNLATISNDSGLEQAIFTIDTSSPLLLLIEDIDTTIPARELDKEKKLFSLGTLLNVLDGVTARENIVLFITTNNRKELDPALIRPGRIDRCIKFTSASRMQIQSAIQLFFPDGNRYAEELLFPQADAISMSSVQESLVSLSGV